MNGKLKNGYNDRRQSQGRNQILDEIAGKSLECDLEDDKEDCPFCGSNDVGCYANGLCFCRNCGRVWEVKVGRGEAPSK